LRDWIDQPAVDVTSLTIPAGALTAVAVADLHVSTRDRLGDTGNEDHRHLVSAPASTSVEATVGADFGTGAPSR
jgi:hypothetical protein